MPLEGLYLDSPPIYLGEYLGEFYSGGISPLNSTHIDRYANRQELTERVLGRQPRRYVARHRAVAQCQRGGPGLRTLGQGLRETCPNKASVFFFENRGPRRDRVRFRVDDEKPRAGGRVRKRRGVDTV